MIARKDFGRGVATLDTALNTHPRFLLGAQQVLAYLQVLMCAGSVAFEKLQNCWPKHDDPRGKVLVPQKCLAEVKQRRRIERKCDCWGEGVIPLVDLLKELFGNSWHRRSVAC